MQFVGGSQREHPVFETTLVRAKHSDEQLLVLTERLFARIICPYIIGMLTSQSVGAGVLTSELRRDIVGEPAHTKI